MVLRTCEKKNDLWAWWELFFGDLSRKRKKKFHSDVVTKCLLFEPREEWEWVKGDVPLVGWCFWQQYNRCCKKGTSLKMKISYRLAFVQNCNVDREVRAHPKTSWLNCRCCAKPSGKSRYFISSKQFLAVATYDVYSVWHYKILGHKVIILHFFGKIEFCSENRHYLIGKRLFRSPLLVDMSFF